MITMAVAWLGFLALALFLTGRAGRVPGRSARWLSASCGFLALSAWVELLLAAGEPGANQLLRAITCALATATAIVLGCWQRRLRLPPAAGRGAAPGGGARA